jgi:hemerythrin
MLSIAWDDSIIVGIPTIDDDHKKLVDMLNELFAACFAAQGPAVLGDILDQLLDYTKYHFEREEKMLEEANYGRLEEHRVLHKRMVAQVEKIQKNLQSGATHDLSNETLKFLSHWLTDHIQAEDKEFRALPLK